MRVFSAPQLAHRLIGSPEWRPPIPKRGERYGADPACWLCGGETGGVGWPQRGRPAFDPATFTNVNAAAVPTSQTVCQACVYLSTNEGWRDHLARAGQPPPASQRLGWRNYSHAFSPGIPSGHRRLGRADLRESLLDPPAPPFVLCIALTGQKHTIFRAQIAYSSGTFPVQVEEDTLIVDRERLRACLTAVEAALAAGLTRDDVFSGEPPPHRIARLGIREWRRLDAELVHWRNYERDLFRLVLHIARRLDGDDDAHAQSAPAATVHPT
jgi:hypothetical protein